MDPKHIYPQAPPGYGEISTTSVPETHYMRQVPGAVVEPQTVIPNVLGNGPSIATCPACNGRQLTTVTYEANSKTHLIALLMVLLGMVCCFCIPYCTKSCQTAVHKCGRCGAYIGSYEN